MESTDLPTVLAKTINIYFKIATTGLSKRNQIVQLAAVGPNSTSFNQFIYPSETISQDATSVHGIYRGVDGKLFRNQVLLPACTIGIKLFCLNI
jgi:DNA polymerase III alpha subunit (gram-positive type)